MGFLAGERGGGGGLDARVAIPGGAAVPPIASAMPFIDTATQQ
jgi:hypothetical protein